MMFLNWICGIICLVCALIMLSKGDMTWFLIDISFFAINTLFALDNLKRRIK